MRRTPTRNALEIQLPDSTGDRSSSVQGSRSDEAISMEELRDKNEQPSDLTLRGGHKILVINCGSSSLKYSFYDTSDDSRHAHGVVERIGIDGTRLVHRGPQKQIKRDLPRGAFTEAFQAMVN